MYRRHNKHLSSKLAQVETLCGNDIDTTKEMLIINQTFCTIGPTKFHDQNTKLVDLLAHSFTLNVAKCVKI
jgi:hypothetical protein